MTGDRTGNSGKSLHDFFDDKPGTKNQMPTVRQKTQREERAKFDIGTETTADNFDNEQNADGSSSEADSGGTSPVLKDFVIIQMERDSPRFNKISTAVNRYRYNEGWNSDQNYAADDNAYDTGDGEDDDNNEDDEYSGKEDDEGERSDRTNPTYHDDGEGYNTYVDDSDHDKVNEGDNDADESVMDEDGEREIDDTDKEDAVDEYKYDIPFEGKFEIETPSHSRLTRINTALYSSDGEDFTGVRITRSFADRNRDDVVSAGANTLGELIVSLKRKRAAEVRNQAGNTSQDQVPVSMQLIQKRQEENEKLTRKGKERALKAIVPFVTKVKVADSTFSDLVQSRVFVAEDHDVPTLCSRGPIPRSHVSTPDDTPLPDERASRLCSTEIDCTSTDRNTLSDLRKAYSASSDTSGRMNPQAKCDSEVRSSGKTREPEWTLHTIGSTGKPRDPLWTLHTGKSSLPQPDVRSGNKPVLPAIESELTGSRPYVTLPTNHVTTARYEQPSSDKQKPREQIPRRVAKLKPPIPHQLRSVACYHDGNVDVSIIGEQRLLGNNQPLNVKITVVRERSLPVVKPAVTVGMSKLQRQMNLANDRQLSGNLKHTLHKISNATKETRMAQRDTILPPVQVPNMNGNRTLPLDKRQKKRRNFTSKKKKSANKSAKLKVDKNAKFAKVLIPRNTDVIHQRAQWPPFNTNVDPEASARYHRLF